MPSLFDTLVEVLAPHLLPVDAAVCPAIPPVSEWAETALGFHPEPKQKEFLDHPSRRLIVNAARQWGKTTLAAVKALHTAIFRPKSRIVVISRSLAKAALLIGKVRQFAGRLGYPAGSRSAVALPNGSRITAIAGTEANCHGTPAEVVVIDEAARVADGVIGAASALLARTNGSLWLLSTPYGQTGRFYSFWHGPGWHKIKAAVDHCPNLDEAFLAEQRRLFPERFRREYNCEFLPAQTRLLTRERVEAMLDPSLEAVEFRPLLSGRT